MFPVHAIPPYPAKKERSTLSVMVLFLFVCLIASSLVRLRFLLGIKTKQAAISFVNDSLLTTLCLQYCPYDVAASVVYLAYLYMGLPRVNVALLETSEVVVGGEYRDMNTRWWHHKRSDMKICCSLSHRN